MLIMTLKRFQANLQFLNYYWNNIDGIKGAGTSQATIKFKQDYKVQPQNDIIDQICIDFMRDLICKIQKIIGATVDGVAGNDTKAKLKIWQQKNGLTADGIAGKNTLNKMFGTPTGNWNFKHFKKSEFNCKCCGSNFINYKLVEICERIRNHFNKPMIITSGCRCVSHNRAVGGVAGSYHTKGTAVDFYISGVNTAEVLSYTKKLVNEGVLRYTYTNNSNMSGAVHIDIGA